MIKIKIQGWTLLMAQNIPEENAKALFQSVRTSDYQEISILKDTSRSSVKRIQINNKDLTLKIPYEKNNRLWIRFLTWFRIGEAFKNIYGMQKLATHGIPSTIPVLAAERRKMGMVVDSWLLYEYLEGQSCLDRPETYPKVVQMLKQIHAEKLLHGDPQIRNFITHKDQLLVIDANPKDSKSRFSRAYEFAYLRKSAPDIEPLFGEIRDWFWYKIARMWDSIDRWRARNKARVKGRT
jgi:tRNA A-37 threonylcarbamoyl transferase component Bud32